MLFHGLYLRSYVECLFTPHHYNTVTTLDILGINSTVNIQNVHTYNTQKSTNLINSKFSGFDPADLLQYIVKDSISGNLACSLCSRFSHRSRANVRNHIESKHFPNTFVYSCPICCKNCPSHQSLLKHKSLFHKD